MTEEKLLLDMRNITKTFPGVKALDNVNFKLKKGTVHSLMGENGAGKSTLMKVLFGIYQEDGGEIYIEGQKNKFANPKQAMENGVSMVHQELNQVMKRDVADNMLLGRYPKKGLFIDQAKMYKYCEEVFDDLGINVNPKAITEDLSVAERQLVEIAKAVSYDAKILVLDEPTSSLTEQEVEILFTIIDKLKNRGVGIIYISHKMDEILRISDDVTIMRDGQWVATEPAKDLTTDKIIALMVGRTVDNVYPPKTNKPEEVVLEVNNLTGMYEPTIKDASFNLRKGEILGVAGLVGSRRTELIETIFGIRTTKSGEIKLTGHLIENTHSVDAIKNGFALVTEEGRATGLFPMETIQFNSIIANTSSYKKGLLLDDKLMATDTDQVIKSMNVKTPSKKTQIRSLSGGNQQKVILGRWLLTSPDILLLELNTKFIN